MKSTHTQMVLGHAKHMELRYWRHLFQTQLLRENRISHFLGQNVASWVACVTFYDNLDNTPYSSKRNAWTVIGTENCLWSLTARTVTDSHPQKKSLSPSDYDTLHIHSGWQQRNDCLHCFSPKICGFQPVGHDSFGVVYQIFKLWFTILAKLQL